MTKTETKQFEQDQKVSALAQDPTYGEKLYENVFHHGINFWLNLVVSAGFTYWVSHSRNNIKLPFVEKIPKMAWVEKTPILNKVATYLTREHRAPSKIQQDMANGIARSFPLRIFKENDRAGLASTMAGVLTLTTAGHFIMIPSVWLGAKLKAGFVKNADRKHYGDEAMEDPSLKLRHAMIEAEERPTLFGTILGRAGTIVATQSTAYTVGNATRNIPRWLGEKFHIPLLNKFVGIDHFTEMAGDKIGGAIGEMIPGTSKLNQAVSNLGPRGYAFSNAQKENFAELAKANPDFKIPTHYGDKVPHPTRPNDKIGGGVPEHFGKYLVSDVMYTAVTSVTIMPAINFLKKFIPGMTYKPKLSVETQAIIDNAPPVRVRPHPIAEQAPQVSASNSETPKIHVSNIKHESRIRETAQAMGVTA